MNVVELFSPPPALALTVATSVLPSIAALLPIFDLRGDVQGDPFAFH